jgi:hypothetical protein
LVDVCCEAEVDIDSDGMEDKREEGLGSWGKEAAKKAGKVELLATASSFGSEDGLSSCQHCSIA